MKIHVTNYCSMGCKHCMEGSTVAEPHMTWETFLKALELTRRLETRAWSAGAPPLILVSGGEATEHPEIVRLLEEIQRQDFAIMLISNGTWLAQPALKNAILGLPSLILAQITNDPRYYPTAPPRVDHPKLFYVDTLTQIIPLGRGAKITGQPKPTAPPSFNVRAVTRQLGDVTKALEVLRLRAAAGLSGHCKPTITADGRLTAGETQNCWTIGTVDSTALEVTRNILAMGTCNRCGLEAQLPHDLKVVLGVSRIHLPVQR